MEDTNQTPEPEGDAQAATAETCVYQNQVFPAHSYTDAAGAILTGPDGRTYCGTCGFQPPKSTDADKPVHVGLVPAQKAGRIREVTGSLVDFDDPDRWPCMPRMVAASSPDVREVARVARARELALWNDTERGDANGKGKDPKKLDPNTLPPEYQRRYRADIVVACLRNGGVGTFVYLAADGEEVSLDLGDADGEEETQLHFSEAIEAAPEVLWLVDDLHRAATLLNGPMAGTDEPKVSDQVLLDLEIEKKGFACGPVSHVGMRGGATTRSSDFSSGLEDLKVMNQALALIREKYGGSTTVPPTLKPSSDSTPSPSGDSPAAPAG